MARGGDAIKLGSVVTVLGGLVALTTLGVLPRCDELQTVEASTKAHAELKDKDEDLQKQIIEIHNKELDYFHQIMRKLNGEE